MCVRAEAYLRVSRNLRASARPQAIKTSRTTMATEMKTPSAWHAGVLAPRSRPRKPIVHHTMAISCRAPGPRPPTTPSINQGADESRGVHAWQGLCFECQADRCPQQPDGVATATRQPDSENNSRSGSAGNFTQCNKLPGTRVTKHTSRLQATSGNDRKRRDSGGRPWPTAQSNARSVRREAQ